MFAVHPLRVESVVWIAERKDVLSMFFFMLTLGAYAWYVRRPRIRRYLTVPAVFVLGLLSKTTLITVPAILLLLDYWPLGRLAFDRRNLREKLPQLVLEKIPMGLLAIAAAVVAIYAEKADVISYANHPFWDRAQNAALSYVAYLTQTLAPIDLSPFYPFPASPATPWLPGLAVLLLAGISAWAFALLRRAPYVAVGWF